MPPKPLISSSQTAPAPPNASDQQNRGYDASHCDKCTYRPARGLGHRRQHLQQRDAGQLHVLHAVFQSAGRHRMCPVPCRGNPSTQGRDGTKPPASLDEIRRLVLPAHDVRGRGRRTGAHARICGAAGLLPHVRGRGQASHPPHRATARDGVIRSLRGRPPNDTSAEPGGSRAHYRLHGGRLPGKHRTPLGRTLSVFAGMEYARLDVCALVCRSAGAVVCPLSGSAPRRALGGQLGAGTKSRTTQICRILITYTVPDKGVPCPPSTSTLMHAR